MYLQLSLVQTLATFILSGHNHSGLYRWNVCNS